MTTIRLQELRIDGNPRLPGGGQAPSHFVVKKSVPNSLFAAGEVDAILHVVETGWIYIVKAGKVRMVRVERVNEADPGEAEAVFALALSGAMPTGTIKLPLGPVDANGGSRHLVPIPDSALPELDASGAATAPKRTMGDAQKAAMAAGRERARLAKLAEKPGPVVGAPPTPPSMQTREAALAEREAMQVKAAGG